MSKRLYIAIATISLSLCLAGCLARNGPVLTAPQQINFTINQSVSAVAAINKSLASDVIALTKTAVIRKETANSILTWQRSVAVAVIAGEAIQRSDKTDVEKALALKEAFAQLPLPETIAALVKSNQTDPALVALITTIQSIQILISSINGVAK